MKYSNYCCLRHINHIACNGIFYINNTIVNNSKSDGGSKINIHRNQAALLLEEMAVPGYSNR